MLELNDFLHLPQLDTLVERLTHDVPGLVVVAGLEPRPLATARLQGGLQPSGRSMIFGILARQLLAVYPASRTVVVAESKGAVRLPSRKGISYAWVQPPHTFASHIADAVQQRAKLLVVERLAPECVVPTLEAAQQGICVIAQLDTVFRGAEVARHLADCGASAAQLAALRWVMAVQRLPTLCPHCKQPERIDRTRSAALRALTHGTLPAGPFYRGAGCSFCNQTGRQGDIAAFDVYPAGADAQSNALSLHAYALGLAALGHLCVDDILQLDGDRLQQTVRLLNASEQALAETNTALRGKLAELEVASRVMQQQTDASISLQEIGHVLITLTELKELASFVCRKASDLCEADRAVLYLLRSDGRAEIIAVRGWAQTLVHTQLDMALLFGEHEAAEASATEPERFAGRPPGIPDVEEDVEGIRLRAGLRVPLVAQQEIIGLLIFHSTTRPRFAPREVALLRALANQSALAIQRASLIESLRDKIDRLEAAQVVIAQKERLDREMELAREVQQSMLPKAFPLMAGFEFAARSAPARHVGGDFYDVILLDAGLIGIAMADVVDKGMSAALYMALTRSVLLAEARRERSPALVLRRVHRLLLELMQPGLFVTIVYGVLDASAQTFTYVRAGHERPLLLRDGSTTLLRAKGAAIGLLELDEVQLEEERIDLLAGDRIVLYTDGLADALGANDESFGLPRLVNALLTHRTSALNEMCDAVFAAVAAHQGVREQYDDMSLLAVEVSG